MPRPNRTRDVFAERNVAANVARLRRQQDPPWSIEGLAERLSAVGCAIHPSALYKMEKADPPRRVTVDELVGFARVFGLPIAELVREPGELLTKEFAAMQERLSLLDGVAAAAGTIAAEAREAAEQLIGEWNDFARATAGSVPEPATDAQQGTQDEIARQVARRGYEVAAEKALRAAVNRLRPNRSTASGQTA